MRRIVCVLMTIVTIFCTCPVYAAAAETGDRLSSGEERLLAAVLVQYGEVPFAARVAMAAVVLRRYAHDGGTMAQALAGTGLLAAYDPARSCGADPALYAAAYDAVRAAENGADPSCGAWYIRLPGCCGASYPGGSGNVCFSCGGIQFLRGEF